MMNQNEFERLTLLSEKSLTDAISPDELKEFKQLLDEWNHSAEFNLLLGFHSRSNLHC